MDWRTTEITSTRAAHRFFRCPKTLREKTARNIAIVTVVSADLIQEFQLLRYSFDVFHRDLFHCDSIKWFVFGDQTSAHVLADQPDVHCTVLNPSAPAIQKLIAAEYVWSLSSWDTVVLADPMLVFTAPSPDLFLPSRFDVTLSPHYCHESRKAQEQKGGLFNTGFIAMHTSAFSRWWAEAAIANPSKTPQQILDDAPANFRVRTTSHAANAGFWRGSVNLEFDAIASDCCSLNVPFFQPAGTALELVRKAFSTSLLFGLGKGDYKSVFTGEELTHKAFALHCLQFLKESSEPRHCAIYDHIVASDRLGLYAALTAAA